MTNNVLVKNNIFVGYQIDNNRSAYVRLENDGYRSSGFDWGYFKGYFDHVKLDYAANHKNIKYGVEAILNTRGSYFKDIIAVVQHYNEEHKLTSKLRVNKNLDISAVFKFPSRVFKDIATASIGLHASNLINDKRAFKYGGQLEFNV